MRLRDPNLRLNEYERLRHFVEWILSIGNGILEGISLQEGSEANWIQIPSEFLIPNENHGLDNLISKIYLLDTMIVVTSRNAAYLLLQMKMLIN